MSTSCLIALKTKEGKFKAIYCHSDGYLAYNGMILLNYYKDYDKVEKLLNLGDISSLGTDPSAEENQTIQTSTYMINTYVRDYKRWTNEDIQTREYTFKEFNKKCQKSGVEYIYLFLPTKDGGYRWLFKEVIYTRKYRGYEWDNFYHMCNFKPLTQRAIDIELCRGYFYQIKLSTQEILRTQSDNILEALNKKEEYTNECLKILTRKQFEKAYYLYIKEYHKCYNYMRGL